MNVLLTTDSDLLGADFRQAMDIPLAEEQRLREALQSLMAQLLARRDLKYDSKMQSMLLACRLRLRVLQNLLLCERREAAALCRSELRELTEDLCAAADLLLHPLGRVVRFEAPEEPAEALCVPRDFSWLVLELICNAARHCQGEEIRVSLDLLPRYNEQSRSGELGVCRYDRREPRRWRRPQACFLTVECKGPLDLERLHAAGAKQGSGVSALLRTAWLHHGAILWLHRDGMSVAALRLPLLPSYGNWDRTQRSDGGARNVPGEHFSQAALAAPPQADAPDYVELLSDRCSQVYIALAPVIAMVTP